MAQVVRSSQPAARAVRSPAAMSWGLQTAVAPAAVAVLAEVDQVGDLVEGEAEALRSLDDPEHGQGFGRIQPVPARAAMRLGE